MLLRALLGFILYGYCLTVFAHKASDSYLTLNVSADKVSGQWDIALRDLDFAISLDANDDSAITWKELRNKYEAVTTYAFNHLQIFAGESPCQIKPTQCLVDIHTDGAYSVLQIDVDCPTLLTEIGINYTLFLISIHCIEA